VFKRLGPGPWPWGRAEPDSGEIQLFCAIGIAVFVSTTPTSFSGRVAQIINTANLIATWTTIIIALLKGVLVLRDVRSSLAEDADDNVGQPHMDHGESEADVTAWKPGGLVQVIVLLAGSMCCCGSMPMLADEMHEKSRKYAVWFVPGFVAVLQGLVFLAMGLLGYFALGNEIDGDAFKVYTAKHPDWMTAVLQIGLLVLLYCSTPLIMLPAKAQVYSFIKRALGSDDRGGIESASGAMRHGLNAMLVALCVSVRILLGEHKLMLLYTVTAGTAAVWINLYLPGFVLIYMQVVPSFNSGKAWLGSTLIAAWIFLIAVLATVNASVEIAEVVGLA